MKKSLYLLFGLTLLAASLNAQQLYLPRDSTKLVERAQKFWTAVAAGQRLEALEFILPEKKNFFLTGSPVPIVNAKVVGVDLTADPNKASVRIGIDVLSPNAGSGRVNWTITDLWIWRGSNWYVDLANPADIFPKGSEQGSIDPKEFQNQIDKNLQILREQIDLGRLVGGQHLQVEVPIKYTGDLPISIELATPNPLIDMVVAEGITSTAKNLTLLVGTENWEGPFTLPLSLSVRYGTLTAQRKLLVTGEVFVPLAFRQEPPNGPIEEGREFSVFIQNNTGDEVGIHSVSTDATMDIVKQPTKLPPNAEVELVLKRKPGRAPASALVVQLDSPVNGKEIYTYRFRNVRR